MKLLRKAQVGGLQGFILSIVTVAIVLAIGLLVMGELNTTAKTLGTTSVVNESVAPNAGISQGHLLISASSCLNASGNAIVLGTQCNVSSLGTVTVDVANFSDQNALIDYTHYTPSAAYNSSGTLITKLATVPTWLGIIIIVALAFIVLSFFLGRRQ